MNHHAHFIMGDQPIPPRRISKGPRFLVKCPYCGEHLTTQVEIEDGICPDCDDHYEEREE